MAPMARAAEKKTPMIVSLGNSGLFPHVGDADAERDAKADANQHERMVESSMSAARTMA